MPKTRSPRSRRAPKSPEAFHPFRDKPSSGFEQLAQGLQFITGKIEYGESFFAKGLLFEPSSPPKRAALQNKSNQPEGSESKLKKKRLSGDLETQAPINKLSEPESPTKKLKFLPPAPREKSQDNDDQVQDDGGDCCPLCLEELDDTDQQFYPCTQCSYQVCLYCHGRIMENDGKCPGCRSVYGTDTSVSQRQVPPPPPPPEPLLPPPLATDLDANAKSFAPSRNEAAPKGRSDPVPAVFDLTQTQVPADLMGRIRVIQRNLMYITNMPQSMSDQRKLASFQHFGAFGAVARLVLRTIPATKAHQQPVISAYVTYAEEASAAIAIEALNGKFVDGKRLRASYGSNKYCNSFIRGEPCSNPRCSYLHQLSGNHECFWEKGSKKS